MAIPEKTNQSAIEIINPANNEFVRRYQTMSPAQLHQVIDSVNDAFNGWRIFSFEQRGQCFKKAAALLTAQSTELANLMTQEMGKVHKEALGEIKKCAWVCEYYADNAESFLADEEIESDLSDSWVSYQPLGVVLSVMPWNFPFWQVFRFAAPTLMAGNVALLKHARQVTGCALAIEAIFEQAGFPKNVFKSLLISSDEVESVIKHKAVRAVTLTGSTNAGSKVASAAGQYIKKTVLELGGSDPYIVLSDADIKLAAEKSCQSRMINAGQSCIAAKRFIVMEDVYDEFLQAFKAQMQNKVMGDPNHPQSDFGPQANLGLRDKLHQQVTSSIKAGAKCILGGEIPAKVGAWYPATILSDVKSGMPAYDEELFGPVASVIKAKSIDQAIEIANNSEFGLGGAIFTQDITLAKKLAKEALDTGTVAINDFVKSDPRLPFGGVKMSGYGRELSSFGIKEFVNIKTIGVG